jgi:NTE family protein
MGVRGTNHVFDDADSVRINSKPQWAQLEFQTRFYPSLSQHFSLGMEADVMLSTRKLLSTYSASIATAPLFAPTPSAHNAFRAQFRANSFVGVGLIPIYKYSSNLSARLGGYAFIPVRRIIEAEADTPRYGKWLGSAEFFGEADITYHFPFGSLTGYANYSTGHGAEWNFGLSFGVFILPPKFLR